MNETLVGISAFVAVLLFAHWNNTGRSWPFWVFCAVMGTVNWYLRDSRHEGTPMLVGISAFVAGLLFLYWNNTGRSWPFWVFCAVMGTVNWYLRNHG